MSEILLMIGTFTVAAVFVVVVIKAQIYGVRNQATYIITKNVNCKPLSIGMVLEPDEQKLSGKCVVGVLFIQGKKLILEYIDQGSRYGGELQALKAKCVGSPVYKDMSYYIPMMIDKKWVMFAPFENKLFYSQRGLAKETVKRLVIELARSHGNG